MLVCVCVNRVQGVFRQGISKEKEFLKTKKKKEIMTIEQACWRSILQPSFYTRWHLACAVCDMADPSCV